MATKPGSLVRRSIGLWLLLAPLLICNLFPFAVMISTALTPEQEVLSAGTAWIPTRLAWENFADMWETVKFGTALMNSLLVGAITTVLTILVSVPAAYAMVRMNFRAVYVGGFVRPVGFAHRFGGVLLLLSHRGRYLDAAKLFRDDPG